MSLVDTRSRTVRRERRHRIEPSSVPAVRDRNRTINTEDFIAPPQPQLEVRRAEVVEIDRANLEISDTLSTNSFNFSIPTIEDDAEIMIVNITRKNCAYQVFELYNDATVVNKKLIVNFVGEVGVDGGGLTKEMFSLFFSTIENTFFKGEECIVPYLPLNRVRKEKEKFVCIGRALEHMILLTGSLPTKFSKSILKKIGNPEVSPDPSMILDDFLLYCNPCERAMLKKALDNLETMNEKEKEILTNIFQINNFFELPNPKEIKDQILSIANDVICDRPKQFVDVLRQGITVQKYAAFWQQIDFTVYFELCKPTASKIVNCFKYKEPLTNEEAMVLHYLEMYVRCLDSDNIGQFLFFITGSYQMPEEIQIEFNNAVGLVRRPVVSTCSNLLQLSINYTSYQDLKKELNNCLFSEEAYTYNSF